MTHRIHTLLIFTFAFCFTALLLVTLTPAFAEEDEPQHSTYELLQLFGDVFDRVRTDYVEEVKDDDLIESAINGMLTSLDPHSGYLNARNFKEMQVKVRGEFGGLGIEVTMENGLVKVVSPIDDTPAYNAGVESGDYISHIDDEPVFGMTLSDAVDRMRGKKGSDVALTILRESLTEPLEVTITRDIIKLTAVKARAEGDIAYVRIIAFTEKTNELMRKEITRLKKEMGEIRGMILDLRNNPGGPLDQAIAVSDSFLAQGEIVSTRDRDPENTKRYSANPGDEIIPLETPIVALINNGSASASEIVVGALKDHKRAIVLGTTSFGKGSVQTVIPIQDHGAIKLTTSRYYTPSGVSIQATGITPDIEVEPAKIEPLDSEKYRTEADLRNRLKRLDEKKPVVNEESKSKFDETFGQDVEYLDDYQLQRALDLIQAVSVYQNSAQQ